MGKLYRMPRSHSYLWMRILPLVGIFILTFVLIWSMAAHTALAATLKQGSYGDDVKILQKALQQHGYYSGSIDGVYGSNTTKAVRNFQKSVGLSADGIAGAQTILYLGLEGQMSGDSVSSGGNTAQPGGSGSQGGGNAASSGLSQDEVSLLARAIHAEAEGEPYIGKVAVGAVLINRVRHQDFPNSLSGVVYQSLALESVSNGRMNGTSGAESQRAAKDAAAGWDPTYGCLYFWNPATATSTWIWSRDIAVQYGQHVFGK